MHRRKKILFGISIFLIVFAASLDAYQAFSGSIPGLGTVVSSRGQYSVPNGTLQPINALAASFFNYTGTVSNNTISFDVLGTENAEPNGGLVYNVTTTGSITVTFLGAQPKVICGFCTSSYTGRREVISYSGSVSDTLIVVWTGQAFTAESKKVLLIDDFLTGPIIDSQWTIDLYNSPANFPGEFTSAGFLSMQAKSTSGIETVHATVPIYNPSSYTTGVAVKRKMTVSMYPFAKLESPATASVRVGLDPLLLTGSYPGNAPAGTPNTDFSGNCAESSPIGSAFLVLYNDGSAFAGTCGDGSKNFISIATGLNPSLYTVATVETYGIFCSSCTDNVYSGTEWIYFRVYQEDSNSIVISSSDNNLNFTSGVAPLFQKTYAFISQFNTNSAATNQQSYIDLVQVQNYGSPVCLFGCIPPIDLTGLTPFSSIWASIVSLCQWMGLGNLGMGAFFLFVLLNCIVIGATVAVGTTYGDGAPTFVVVAEFFGISAVFLTLGLMGSVWLFAILIVDVVVALFTFRTVFLKGSLAGEAA